jgi:hypothetical protein
LKKPLVGGVRFDIGYKRSWLADVWFVLDVEGLSVPLFFLSLSFCNCCGRELGFGVKYDVCGDCKEQLDDDELELVEG